MPKVSCKQLNNFKLMLTWHYPLMFWIFGKQNIQKKWVYIKSLKFFYLEIQTFLDYTSIAKKYFLAKQVLTSAVTWFSWVSPSKFCFRTNQGTSAPSYMFLLHIIHFFSVNRPHYSNDLVKKGKSFQQHNLLGSYFLHYTFKTTQIIKFC